ncbi:MAG: tRNA (adenosine(37)-N6)-threonylcarbamoyltransferase complex ATPase subunit type 1 TsaE [Kordiimonadaceae bacterium]|jgi:tRNA threonylcarbamoyladenosine biosynthesis protein TsaE|nr:tRNA (adenosine(37)-N6)-threonylcarbamoyltransferase complex ATPase subunit type 1 TsaE [Kordiimonadaceae bacterium]MBT6031150.1 tRNA (adenosine(37)-N6)-threonylcarbamoyltransferase complex ATPase subunit type 1 TsaE [Kordiimonadaceae bacterium]
MTQISATAIKEFFLKDLVATRKLARELSSILNIGDILTFKGNLGAGKTEFCRAIIHALGYNEDVPSPTFNLVQIYEPQIDDIDTPSIWHMDLYRLDNPEDVFELGIEDGFDTAISLIEWPERMGKYLPSEHLQIFLSMDDIEGSRKISFEGSEYWRVRLNNLELPNA